MFVKYGSAPDTSSNSVDASEPGTFVPPTVRNALSANSWLPVAGKSTPEALVNVMSKGTRMRCGACGLAAFSKSMSGFREIEIPARFANDPVGLGIVTPSALNELSLNPSITSQNAFGHTPPLVLMMSCTSSVPKVSLFAQNDIIASGYGLSVTGTGMLAVALDGNTCSSSPAKNGYGFPASPVRV